MIIDESYRELIALQTAQNFVEAGILLGEEVPEIIRQLKQLSLPNLLSTLVQSHNLREQKVSPINFYPIDMRNISQN